MTEDAEPLRLRACTVDLVRREVRHDDGRLERLTPREAELLAWLAGNPDRIVTRDELLHHVWGYAPTVVTRVVDTTVRRLREKVEADPQAPDHVLTSFGEGYRFVPGIPAEEPPEPEAEPEEEPFVGREVEVAALRTATGRAGTVSVLLGPPGAGKTRIARHLAWRLSRPRAAGGHRSGAVFVDVTEARDRAQIAGLLSQGLGIEAGESGVVALRRAGDALRGRGPCLVVLDNCEGVAAHVGDVLAALRAVAPEARFVATSRARIPVEGALEVPIGALAVAEAVELFAVLAARVRPGFAVDAENRSVLERLAERLEGIPLAIGLAAGRAGALSPRAILERLDDRFRLLASKSRDSDPRQRTLTAALDWSWDLLGPSERETLAACSAFRGGFDLVAAARVVGRPDTEALVASLCASSLLERRGDSTPPGGLRPSSSRFGGYAFVREYATRRLAEDPAAEAAVFLRHAEEFAARYDESTRGARGERGHWLSRDRANLVVATERMVAAGRADLAHRAGLGALDVIGREGPFEQAFELANLILSLSELPTAVRVLVRQRLAVVELWTGLGDPWQTLELAFEDARGSGDPAAQSQVLRTRGMVLRTRGRGREALPVLEEALALARGSTSFDALANVMSTLGVVLRELGRIEDARAVWVELVEASKARDDLVHLTHATGNLALIERRLGQIDAAREHYESSLDYTVRSGDRRAEGVARVGIGNLELELGHLDRAREHYQVALRLANEVGVRESEARILGNLGLLERTSGNIDAARGHLGAALRAFEEIGEVRQAVLCRGNLGEVELVSGRTEQARALLVEVTGELAAMGDGPSEAEFLGPLVDALLTLGDLAEARARVDRGEALARTAGNPLLLAQILARRGLVELAEGGAGAAATLAEAEPLAARAGPESDTARALARLATAARRSR